MRLRALRAGSHARQDRQFKAYLMVGNFAVRLCRFAVEQRFATGKSILDAVPVVDVRFADLPTEENHFRAEHAGKVDQSLLDAFANTTVAIDLFDPTLHLPNQFGDLSVIAQSIHQIRRLRIEPFFSNHRFAGALKPANISRICSTNTRTFGNNSLASSTVNNRGK